MSEWSNTIEAVINNDVKSLRPALHLDLVTMTAKRLGYDFLTDERLKRVAVDSMAIMDWGLPYPYAFAEAVHNELVMYGDPRGGIEPVGIMQ
jgi:hypothetical protein